RSAHFVIYPPPDRRAYPPVRRESSLLIGHVLEPEDGQDAALGREAARVAEGAERAETGGRVFRADASGHADAGPATDTGVHGNVLVAIGPVVGHRVADDAGRGLE